MREALLLQKNPFRAMALMSAILSQLAGSTLVGLFVGRWIDRSLSTEPIFLIFGLLLGLAAGVYAMIHTVRKFDTGD